MTLLRRRSFLRVLHMSGTCLADVKTIHNMHHVLQVNVSVTCPRPCQSRHAGTRLRVVPASASHASQPKRTKKNQKEPKRTDTSWPSSSSSSSECGKSSGDTKPVPAKHCLETCLIQALQCEQDSGWTFLSLSQKDWLSRSNCCQRFPHWLHHSSPTKPQNPCLFAMLCGGFEKVMVPSHPAHLIFVSRITFQSFHANACVKFSSDITCRYQTSDHEEKPMNSIEKPSVSWPKPTCLRDKAWAGALCTCTNRSSDPLLV